MASANSIDAREVKFVALCPWCGAPHQYSEFTYTAVNDDGFWLLDCQSCGAEFVIQLKNAVETRASFHVRIRGNEPFTGDSKLIAKDVIHHNLETDEISHIFKYNQTPLYLCRHCGANAELSAQTALKDHFEHLLDAYRAAINFGLKGSLPGVEHVVIHVAGECECRRPFTATYYVQFLTNGDMQSDEADYLLADVTTSDLANRLDGLFSKTEVMQLLEKLIIRWHLTASQLVIASPFVGHTFLKSEQKLGAFDWLFSLLDPKLSIFITRRLTKTTFKKALEEVEGLDHATLEKYGLDTKLISADLRKQDFHAKFFIGIGESSAEVLSGSANIVEGPSIENISFRSYSKDQLEDRYLSRLKLTLPPPRQRPQRFVHIFQKEGKWISTEGTGSRLPR